jgi:RNA polymerase sigma-70 factor (ECF subfamily)
MAAHAAGDEKAFAELFRRYAPELLAMFRRSLRRDEEARDLVQQTFLHVHRARLDYRSGCALRPWIYTIARNLMRDLATKASYRNEVGVDAEALDRTSSLEASSVEERHTAKHALASLGKADRELVESVYLEGSTFEEVGQQVGRTALAMRVRAHRIMSQLRILVAERSPA